MKYFYSPVIISKANTPNHTEEMLQMRFHSVFCHGVDETFTLLGCYTAEVSSRLPTCWDNIMVQQFKNETT